MDFQGKGKSEESNLKKSADIAKEQHSFDHVEDSEEARLHHNGEADVPLEQILTDKLETNPNECISDPTDTDFDKERQKQLEIEAKNQLEQAQYAEMNTNRFKMRTKVLSLEVSVILKKYENGIANGPNNTVPVTGEIENLVAKIHKALKMTDLGEAEKHLTEAERIYKDAYAKIPKTKNKKDDDSTPISTELIKRKHTPGPREKTTMPGNERDEDICIQKAKDAIKHKDFERAEKFLLKAERLLPTEEAKKWLRIVRVMASRNESAETINNNSSQVEPKTSNEPAKDADTTREDNQRIAKKITRIAETSFKEGNYEKAKLMLERAELLCPSEEAKATLQLIIQIKAEKEKSIFSTLCNIL